MRVASWTSKQRVASYSSLNNELKNKTRAEQVVYELGEKTRVEQVFTSWKISRVRLKSIIKKKSKGKRE